MEAFALHKFASGILGRDDVKQAYNETVQKFGKTVVMIMVDHFDVLLLKEIDVNMAPLRFAPIEYPDVLQRVLESDQIYVAFLDGKQQKGLHCVPGPANNNVQVNINVTEKPDYFLCGACEQVSLRKLKHCGKCKVLFYCNAECQQKHWPEHKPVCLLLEQLN